MPIARKTLPSGQIRQGGNRGQQSRGDYIVYDRASGVLSYDADGNGAGGAIGFAVLSNHAVLTAADFLVI